MPTLHRNIFPLKQQANQNELNPSNDGFLSSMFNEEDLQLIDMTVNEGEAPFPLGFVNGVKIKWLRQVIETLRQKVKRLSLPENDDD